MPDSYELTCSDEALKVIAEANDWMLKFSEKLTKHDVDFDIRIAESSCTRGSSTFTCLAIYNMANDMRTRFAVSGAGQAAMAMNVIMESIAGIVGGRPFLTGNNMCRYYRTNEIPAIDQSKVRGLLDGLGLPPFNKKKDDEQPPEAGAPVPVVA